MAAEVRLNGTESTSRALLWVVTAAIVVRLGVLFAGPWHDPERAMQPDSERYFVLADNLERYRTFGKAVEDGVAHRAIERVRQSNGTLPAPDRFGLKPESFRTPGYPLFIAAIERLARDRRAILLCQCVLGGMLAAAVILVARRAGANIALAMTAGIVWALHPALVAHDNLFLSEALFNIFCVAGVFAASGSSIGSVLVAGLLIGAGALVRPLGLLYLPMALAFTWRLAAHRRIATALLVIVAVLPSLGWAWRNSRVGEGFRVSTVGDHNLFFYTLPFALAEEQSSEWGQLSGADHLAEELRKHVAPGEDVSAAARRFAVHELKRRPAAVVRVHLKSWTKLVLDHSTGTLAQLLGLNYSRTGLFSRFVLRERAVARPGGLGSVLIAVAWMGLNAVLAAVAALGCVAALRRRDVILLATTATLVLFFIATGAVGLERLRLPMLLPMIVLGATAFTKPDLRERAARAEPPDSARTVPT